MTLKHQEQLDLIENCPLDNEKGELTLYRIVENPITEESFIPHAVLFKPKYKKKCIAWGLSMFSDIKYAIQSYNNLSQSLLDKVNYQSVASARITDADGVKYKSGSEKHYTVHPKEDAELTSKFTIIIDDIKQYEQ